MTYEYDAVRGKKVILKTISELGDANRSFNELRQGIRQGDVRLEGGWLRRMMEQRRLNALCKMTAVAPLVTIKDDIGNVLLFSDEALEITGTDAELLYQGSQLLLSREREANDGTQLPVALAQ